MYTNLHNHIITVLSQYDLEIFISLPVYKVWRDARGGFGRLNDFNLPDGESKYANNI
jgi:hypothetical protein